MPASPKWTSLLRERSDVWFPPKLIDALRIVQSSIRVLEDVRQIAAELRAEGYAAPWPRPDWCSEDQWLVSSFWKELVSALWPEPVAKALWDKDRELGLDDAEALIRFLEINPFFFRSGYMKPLAIRRLGRCPLTPPLRNRIFGVLRGIVFAGWERQMADWRKLANFCDPEKVRGLVVEALRSEKEAAVKKGTILGLVMLGDTRLLGESKRWMRESHSLGTIQWVSNPNAIQVFLDSRTEEELAHLEATGSANVFEGLIDFWRDRFWKQAMGVVREAFAILD